MYKCPCCEYLTFSEEPDGTFEICPVCFWEDDNVQNSDPNYSGGANNISLNEAKKNFLKYGAIQESLVSSTRDPLPQEMIRLVK